MKIEFFQRTNWGTAIAVLGLLSVPSLINSPAETPPDSALPPSDNITPSAELPEYIYPTSPLAQVIRLSQAGVDESIIQTFIANSSSTFNLDSDKIIYLKDIGLPSGIVTAMMQRDQQLQQQMAAANPPPAQPASATDTNPPTEPPPPPPAEEPSPPPAEVTTTYFYDTLTPYGSWVNVDDYGRCWRPSVCVYNPGWQPYCDHGRWIYTDCGWYWYSDYTWGWAPFHYGRWFRHPHWGWCWTPDTVWGPSWVTWRYSSGYCGWAPLPPFATYQAGIGFFYHGGAVNIGFNWGLGADCFTFVPTQFFCDPHPRRYCAAPGQVTQIFNQTTVINNFNVREHDHRFVNGGIAPDRITTVTHNPIHPVALQTATRPGEHVLRGDQLSRDGSTLVISHPPRPWSPNQNHPPQQNNNRPAAPERPVRPPPIPVVTLHGPQDGGAIRVPPQRPTPPANYNSPPAPAPVAPNYNNRINSPRGREQNQSRGNPYGSAVPPFTPPSNPGQSGTSESGHHTAPATAPAPPPAQSSQRSSGQNQNNSGNSTGNNYGSGPGNGPGNGPVYGSRH